MAIPKRTVNHGGLHADHNEDAHRHRGAAALGRNAAHGTIASISGTTFVLTTKHGEPTVTTDADTDYHSPGRAGEAREGHLSVAALKVGQRVAVQGERPNDTMLLAKRVHIPQP